MPTEEEIQRQIDFLARWKGNQYYFYSELSIELKGYPLINPGARYTQEQVRRIIQYARERHVDVVPCLEFYGHLHDLFRIERYAGSRGPAARRRLESPQPAHAADGEGLGGSDDGAVPQPLVPHRPRRAVGTGAGRQRRRRRRRPGQPLSRALEPHGADWFAHGGKRVLFWADVAAGAALFEKYPQLASQLPPETVAVPWHYHAEKDYTRMLAPFSQAKVPQVIGTGIWAWDTIVPNFPLTFPTSMASWPTAGSTARSASSTRTGRTTRRFCTA